MKKYLALMLSLAMLAAMPSCGKIDDDRSSSKKDNKSSSSVDDAAGTETSEDTEATQDDSEASTEESTEKNTEDNTSSVTESTTDNKNESDKTTTTTAANGTGGSASGGSSTGNNNQNEDFVFTGIWAAEDFLIDYDTNEFNFDNEFPAYINEFPSLLMQMELKKDGTGIGYEFDKRYELEWEPIDNGIKVTDKKNGSSLDFSTFREEDIFIDIKNLSNKKIDDDCFGGKLINYSIEYLNTKYGLECEETTRFGFVMLNMSYLITKTPLPEGAESPVEIVDHKISSDKDGNKVLIIEYSWTNISNQDEPFDTLIDTAVYQNGIQCSENVKNCDDLKDNNLNISIKDGETIKVKKGYYITDDSAVYVTSDHNEVVGFIPGYKSPFVDEEIDLGGKGGYKIPDKLEKTSLTIAEQRIEKSTDGNDIAVIIFDFYNGEDKPLCVDNIFEIGVYQDGAGELEQTYLISDKELLKKYYDKCKIFPGVKTQAVCAAILEDKDKGFSVTLDNILTDYHYTVSFTNEGNDQ